MFWEFQNIPLTNIFVRNADGVDYLLSMIMSHGRICILFDGAKNCFKARFPFHFAFFFVRQVRADFPQNADK